MKQEYKKFLRKSLFYFLTGSFGLVFILPLFWVFSTALRKEVDVYSLPLRIIPPSITLENFIKVFQYNNVPIFRWYLNSFVVATIGTIAAILICSLAAYAFARLELPFKKVLFIIILAAIMVPPESTFIYRYYITRMLGWFDTYQALIIPNMAHVLALFLLRQFFISIPKSIEEAAIIDGCNKFDIYWRIFLPMSKSALATMSIFLFVGYWNDFTWPLLVTNKILTRTLTVGIAVTLQGQFSSHMALLMAGISLAILPIMIVFLVLQRHIIKGMAVTGLKY